MKRTVNRRRFVGLLGTTGIVGAAGCLGDSDGGNLENGGGPNTETSRRTSTSGDQTAEVEEFNFPPGADDGGIVSERVLSGARDVLAATDRYRITQASELDYGAEGSDSVETTYDVGESRVLERQLQDGTEIERLVTPDRTRCRATEIEGDRSGRWTTDAVDLDVLGARSFRHYPFETTAVPVLLDDASLEFDTIVTEDDQQYARYSGTVVQREWTEHRWRDSARLDRGLESPLEGTVSLLLAESGAVRAVEYELTGEIVRETVDGRDTTDAVARGEIRLEYDGLEELTTPEWADSDRFREFAVADRSFGRVYELIQGPALPGSMDLTYAEFYVTAHLDGDRYVAKFSKAQDFEVGDRLFMGIGSDGLELSRFSVSGRNPLAVADWIEIGVSLFHPERGRSLVYHEEFRP